MRIRTSAHGLILACAVAVGATACRDATEPQRVVPDAARLVGRPAAPMLVWSPAANGSYDYGTLDAGGTVSQTFELNNAGGSSSGAVAITLSGAPAFSITADACTGVALGSGKSCTVTVQYTQALTSQSDQASLAASSPKPTSVGASLVLLAATNPPPGHIYWANKATGTIGRANIDGTGVNQSFITGLSQPVAVAVDDHYIYWSEAGTNSIGRANLDGTGMNRTFITGAAFTAVVSLFGDASLNALAVNATHIYWTNLGGNSIGRANIDGTGVNQNFIGFDGVHVPDAPNGLALDGTYLYWIDYTRYGRATLDGSQIDWDFFDNIHLHNSLAVDAAHLYWYSNYSQAIQRGSLSLALTEFDDFFIPTPGDLVTVAVDANHIYWSKFLRGTIGRANIDGTAVQETFITGASTPAAVAVGAR